MGADSWDDAIDALHGVMMRLAETNERGSAEEEIVITSGSPTAGWHMEADEDPGWDHDRYFEAINHRSITGD